MLNNASKFAAGLTVFGVLALAASRLANGDRAGAILLVGVAVVAAILCFGINRTVGPDLPPFAAADAPQASTAVDLSEAPAGSAGPLVVAAAITVVACGGALGPHWVEVGVVAALVGLGLWMFDSLRTPGVLAPRDAKNVDDRLLGPVALPVGAFILAITIAYSFSRVLLAVPETASWVIAFVVAAIVLTVLTMIATRVPPTRIVVSVAGVGLLGVLIAGGAGASVGERDFEKHTHPIPDQPITAQKIAYDRKVIALPADANVEVDFTNLDVGTFHNVAVYTSDEPGTPIFNGKPIDHGTTKYVFKTPDEGTYRYVCDFHPAMTGEFRVTAPLKESK